MKHVTMLDFRRDAERVLAQVQRGERLILTHRGKPVARLEPIIDEHPDPNDPIYSLADLAQSGESLTNAEIDRILYGP